jgi:hypothetical protein
MSGLMSAVLVVLTGGLILVFAALNSATIWMLQTRVKRLEEAAHAGECQDD